MAGWVQCRILPELQRRANTYTPQIVAHNRKTEVTLPNTFYEATVTLITKPHKDSRNRITDLMNIDAKILKVLAN